jgi:hypothetical protein
MPGPRIRLRTLMIAVAVVAVILAVEFQLARHAVRIVSDRGDGEEYIPGEAVMVWGFLQVPFAAFLFFIMAMILAVRESRRRG